MTPELAERLALVFPNAFIQDIPATGVAGVAGVASHPAASAGGVADVSCYAPKPPQLRQLRPLRLEGGNLGNIANEGATAHVVESDADVADAIEERAGLASALVPRVYLDAWAQLNCQKPASVSEAEWRRALDDGGRFLDAWGYVAQAFGWAAGELFNVSAGLVWRLEGERVEFIGSERVRLSGGRTIARTAMKGCG